MQAAAGQVTAHGVDADDHPGGLAARSSSPSPDWWSGRSRAWLTVQAPLGGWCDRIAQIMVTRQADGTFRVQTPAGTSHRVSVPAGFPASLGCGQLSA